MVKLRRLVKEKTKEELKAMGQQGQEMDLPVHMTDFTMAIHNTPSSVSANQIDKYSRWMTEFGTPMVCLPSVQRKRVTGDVHVAVFDCCLIVCACGYVCLMVPACLPISVCVCLCASGCVCVCVCVCLCVCVCACVRACVRACRGRATCRSHAIQMHTWTTGGAQLQPLTSPPPRRCPPQDDQNV